MQQVQVITKRANSNGAAAQRAQPLQDRLLLIQEEPKGPTLLMEIPVPAQVVNSVPLPVEQDLISDTSKVIVIKGLRLVTFAEVATGPSNGLANATLAELQKCTLNIYAEGWLKGFNVSLLGLNNTFIEGSGIPFRDKTTKLSNWQSVQWNKCEIIYSNTTPSNGVAYTFLLEIEYERFDLNGKVIIGPHN